MNTKLRCLLLDDELPGLAYLRTICSQLQDVEIVKAYSDPVKLMQEYKDLDFDIIVTDVHMPGINGIELARAFKNKPVIFTTAYKEYAADAFDLEAVDYIVKPVQKERFEKALVKARQLITPATRANPGISWNSNKGKVKLDVNEVCLIRVADPDKRDKWVFFSNGEELLLKNISFGQLEALLPSNDFCRVNKKELIAVKCIKFFMHDELIIVISGKEIRLTLSPNYKKSVLSKV